MRTRQDSLPELYGDTVAEPPPLSIAERFELFHEANPYVFRELVRRALALREVGVKRWGLKALWEVMRYDRLIATGKEWKLNNDFTAHYARLIMAEVSELRGFFQTRERS